MANIYLIVGHVTTDRGPGHAPQPGGAVYYGAAAAAALGWRVRCLTRAASTVPPELPKWLSDRITWRILPSQYTTTFENVYDDDSQSRSQRVLSMAAPIGGHDVPSRWRHADVVHLAPVIGELRSDCLELVKAAFVGLAAQGWLRDIRDDGSVTASPWRVPTSLEDRAQATAVSAEDLGANPDLTLASRHNHTALLAVTRGAEGADLYWGSVVTKVPACPVDAANATGAGDVFAATLFARLAEGAPAADAGRWAARQAAMLVEAGGVEGLRPREELARLV